MKALTFRNNPLKLAATKLMAQVHRDAYLGRFAPVRLEDAVDPISRPDWPVCETVIAGICGSDSKQVFMNGSLDNPLTALISFPHVLGHEAVARRADTGERVLLNPWLSCVPRQIDPVCAACEAGQFTHCRHFRDGAVSPALHLGNCRDAGGVHAERFAAHESMLFPVPDGVSNDAAVLGDPVSVSLRHVLRNPPDGRPVVVYGCGTLGLCAIALLRHLFPETEVWAISRAGRSAELARGLGASEVLEGAPKTIVSGVADLVGTTPLEPWSRKAWLQDGPGVVYDTVGSAETIGLALRFVGTGGTVAISGVEPPKRFEWTPIYFKEITVRGSNAFAVEERGGVAKHAFEHYFDLIGEGFDATPIITHRFALDDWQAAFRTIVRRRESGAVKVLLEP